MDTVEIDFERHQKNALLLHREANAASQKHRQLLMGEDGEVWDTARLATSSEKRLKQLYQFASFRQHIENLVVDQVAWTHSDCRGGGGVD